jgi:probable rRNA maturation factor
VNVLITNDAVMRNLNNTHRSIDKTTDVLSFPMKEFKPGNYEIALSEVNPESGLFALGDIVLSAKKVHEQALEHRQTLQSETAYLTVHATLHLLGYDHLDEADEKKLMRSREELILKNNLK